MDAATHRRLTQVGSWCTARLDDMASIYDDVRARVWAGDRFKPGMESSDAFAAAVNEALKHHRLAIASVISATDDDARDVALTSTLSGEGGRFRVVVCFGWNSELGEWSTNNIVIVRMTTGRLAVSMNLMETSAWRRDATPFPPEPVQDCMRRDDIGDGGPVRERELVSLVGAMFHVGVAQCVSEAIGNM
jgi:hypothetical protein